MTYIVDDCKMIMRCPICGEGPDEDGHGSCDCHIERVLCDFCNDPIREDLLMVYVRHNYKEVWHCPDCIEGIGEEEDEWWLSLAEDYRDIENQILLTRVRLANHPKVFKESDLP